VSAPVLEARRIDASYGAVKVLHGVTIHVDAGEIVAVLGTNGAGKSTLMNVLAGPHAPDAGDVVLHGDVLTSRPAWARVDRGMALVPEGRRLFADFTVQENLLAGGVSGAKRRELNDRIDVVYDLFPVLSQRRTQVAATLSGGQQQMVAIGRGLMSDPTVLLLDEPSLGLAPLVVRDVFDALHRLNAERGLSLLVVEQNPMFATEYAHRSYVLRAGAVIDADPAERLTPEALRRAYLGAAV
jgi:branched-chain amino acid transport system ATP-binding protein